MNKWAQKLRIINKFVSTFLQPRDAGRRRKRPTKTSGACQRPLNSACPSDWPPGADIPVLYLDGVQPQQNVAAVAKIVPSTVFSADRAGAVMRLWEPAEPVYVFKTSPKGDHSPYRYYLTRVVCHTR